MHAFLVGFGLGFLVALQLGPLSLYLIRSTLRGGLAVGLAIAAGIAVIDLLYAALGAAGAGASARDRAARDRARLLGAAVLVLLGARTLWSAFRIHLGTDGSEGGSPKRAFLTALSATASNPLTIASWAAIFSAASAAGAAGSATAGVLLLAGVGIGSAVWDGILASATALLGRAAGPQLLRTVDLVAGAGLICFGGVLAYSVVT